MRRAAGPPAAEAHAVAAFFIDVQVEAHAGFAQRGGKLEGVFHLHGTVLPRVPDEAFRRLFRDLLFIREQLDEFRRGVVAKEVSPRAAVGVRPHRDDGVAQDAEVGARAEALDRVGGFGLARVEMREQRGGEMPACAGSHDAHALWVDLPLVGLGPREAEGARGVVEHRGMPVAFRAEAGFQNDADDAVFREPFGVACAFVRGESAVAAAGADDEGRAGGFFRCREKGGEGGFVVVCVAECAGRAVRPERDGGERRSVECGGEKEGGQGRKEAHKSGVKFSRGR